jgi:uncharacterized C2H2 Zn-finger protein
MKEFKKNKEGNLTCEECDALFKNIQSLSVHIKNNHKYKDYYDKWLKEDGEGLCKHCGKKTEFISFKKHGYKQTCSNQCMGFYNSSKLTIKSLEKRKQTCIQKYGVESILCSKDIKEAGMMKKHGVTNAYQMPKYREKANNSILEKYGVDNPTQNIIIFNKILATQRKIKQYKNTSLYYQASYELDFLDNYYEMISDVQRGPTIKYLLNGESKIYYPDFYIESLNLIIEIKSLYYAEYDSKKLKAKELAVINNGYEYILILDKNYTEFNDLLTHYQSA